MRSVLWGGTASVMAPCNGGVNIKHVPNDICGRGFDKRHARIDENFARHGIFEATTDTHHDLQAAVSFTEALTTHLIPI